jgi:hypothetical protein
MPSDWNSPNFGKDVETATNGRRCPVSHKSGKFGTTGCGFALLLQQQCAPIASSEVYSQSDQKALTDLLLPQIRPTRETVNLTNADELNPTDNEVLAAALGAPARAVLLRAELTGPRTGWRDGHLSTEHGFCPPDPNASPRALNYSSGNANNTSI